MMDVEFTVEDNVLYILQCRVGKRTGIAALKIATDLVEKNKLITQETPSQSTSTSNTSNKSSTRRFVARYLRLWEVSTLGMFWRKV